MNKKKLIIKVVSIFMVCILLFFQTDTSAFAKQSSKSVNKKAHKEYMAYMKKMLSKPHTDGSYLEEICYRYVDVNGDGIDELIVDGDFCCNACGETFLFYLDGKVKACEQISVFDGYEKYYKKNGIVQTHYAAMGYHIYSYYKFDGKELKLVASKTEESNKTTYHVKNKKVSKDTFKKYIKKITNNSKGKIFPSKYNTLR